MLLATLLLLQAQPAEPAESGAARAAEAFTLDLADDDAIVTGGEAESPAPAAEEPAPAAPAPDAEAVVPADSASEPAPVEAPPPAEPAPDLFAQPPADGVWSLDTPIAAIVADARARAVLDRNLPGMSTDKNLPKFRALSLRRLAPLSGGRLTPALMAQVGTELAALSPAQAPANPSRRPIESR